MAPRAALPLELSLLFLLETRSNDDELLPAFCAAALQEDNNADSVSPAKSRRREFLRVIMGQRGRISGRGRKRDYGCDAKRVIESHMKSRGAVVACVSLDCGLRGIHAHRQRVCPVPAAPSVRATVVSVCARVSATARKRAGKLLGRCSVRRGGVPPPESGVLSAFQPPILKCRETRAGNGDNSAVIAGGLWWRRARCSNIPGQGWRCTHVQLGSRAAGEQVAGPDVLGAEAAGESSVVCDKKRTSCVQVWDDELEQSAAQWAEKCHWDHGPEDLLRSIGQNLAVHSGR